MGTDASPGGLGIYFSVREERGTCSILLLVLLVEVGAKSEQPGLVLRNLALPFSLCLSLAGVFVYLVASAFLTRFPLTPPFYIPVMVVLGV